MSIGNNTRQIILGRLAKSHSLSEIEYCQELWIQTHGYKSLCFIGLTSQLAFDRKAFFIHTKSETKEDLRSRLTPNILLSLRRAVITEELSVIDDVFSDLKLHIFPTYGPQQAVGLFLLSPSRPVAIAPEDRLIISQDLHMFQQAIFTEYFSRHRPSIHLTPREAEVISWVAQGKSNVIIAKIMGVSPHTIDNYLRRVYTKIGVNNRTSAAVKAMVLGLTAL